MSHSIENAHKHHRLLTHQHSLSRFTSKPPSNPNEESKSEEVVDETADATTKRDEEDDSEWEYREVDEESVRKRNYQVISWKTVFATIVVFGIGTILFQQRLHEHRQKQKKPQYASYGEAQIGGGEWRMTDHNGKIVTQNDLKGKYQVVYFGFTFCPDVCPRELTKMANAMQLLEDRGFKIGADIVPVFVSVDPKRDTPELIKKYIRQFHPEIYGLTGSPEQVAAFAKAYKAYFSTPGPGENQDDYIIDHVTMMYIMGRQGEYMGHISTLENADEMAAKIAGMIKDVGHSGGLFGSWIKNPASLVKPEPKK